MILYWILPLFYKLIRSRLVVLSPRICGLFIQNALRIEQWKLSNGNDRPSFLLRIILCFFFFICECSNKHLFPIGGNFDLKISWRKGFNFLHVWIPRTLHSTIGPDSFSFLMLFINFLLHRLITLVALW